jgi:hypothetical protein
MLLGHSLAAPIYWLVNWLVPAIDEGAENEDGDDKTEDATETTHTEGADLGMKGEATANVPEQPPAGRPTMSRFSKSLRDLVHTKHESTLMDEEEENPKVIERLKEKSIQLMSMDATTSTNASRKSIKWAVDDEEEPQKSVKWAVDDEEEAEVIERPREESSQTIDPTISNTGLAQGSVDADPPAEGKPEGRSRRMVAFGTDADPPAEEEKLKGDHEEWPLVHKARPTEVQYMA